MKKKITIGVILALITSIGLGVTWSLQDGEDQVELELRLAWKFLREGQPEFASHMVRKLEKRVDVDQNAAWNLLAGVTALQSANNHPGTREARRNAKDALERLEKAFEIGLPPGFHGEARFYLGYCYYLLNRWKDCIEQLDGLAEQWPERRSEIWRLLVRAYVRSSPPDFAAAEQTLEKWANLPGLSHEEHAQNQLERAVLLFTKGQYDAADSILAAIPEDTQVYSEAQLWRGRVRIWQVSTGRWTPEEKRQRLEEAAQILRALRVDARTPEHIRRQAIYLVGRCRQLQGQRRQALGIFSSLRQTAPQSAEAIGAGIEEAEMLLQSGDYPQAVAILHSLLVNLKDIDLYDDFWLPKNVLKKRMIDVAKELTARGEFALALKHARHLAIAFPLADALLLEGEVLESWGQALEHQPAKPNAQDGTLLQRVTQKYRQAAEAFEHWTLIAWDAPNYQEILWRAIENYQRATDIDKANELLRKYLLFEDRTKRPRALLALGTNLMGLARWNDALEPLERCLIEFPDHPVSYEARLNAARVHIEMQQLDEAAELLEENLYDYQLDPSNQTWQDSLFELGRTLYQIADQLLLELRMNPPQDHDERIARLQASQQKFLTAIVKLNEVAVRSPKTRRHYQARYLVARSYRLAAHTQERLVQAQPDLVDAQRRTMLKQRREMLENALREYQSLQQDLSLSLEALDNAEWAVALLRNAYFGTADTLYEQQRWEEAITAYHNVTVQFLDKPESLEALVQVANCYEKLGRKQDAKHVLATAKQVLARIPRELDDRFIQTTRGSRADWQRWLNEMQSWQ